MEDASRAGAKTLDQFDFAFRPSSKREQIESLHELGFVDRRENVILLGPPPWIAGLPCRTRRRSLRQAAWRSEQAHLRTAINTLSAGSCGGAADWVY